MLFFLDEFQHLNSDKNIDPKERTVLYQTLKYVFADEPEECTEFYKRFKFSLHGALFIVAMNKEAEGIMQTLGLRCADQSGPALLDRMEGGEILLAENMKDHLEEFVDKLSLGRGYLMNSPKLPDQLDITSTAKTFLKESLKKQFTRKQIVSPRRVIRHLCEDLLMAINANPDFRVYTDANMKIPVPVSLYTSIDEKGTETLKAI
jgi:hypothetical protein